MAGAGGLTADRSDPADRPARARRWWQIGWYPLAAPIAFIVLIWSSAALHPVWLVRPLAFAIVATVLLSLVLAALVADSDRGTLAAWAIVVGLVVDDLRLTALLVLVAASIVVEGIVHRGHGLASGRTIRRGMSILAAVLLLATSISLVQNGTVQSVVEDIRSDLDRPRQAATYDPAAPDIVVMLLDGYPGYEAAEALAPAGFDPDAFPNALEARGFQVPRSSRTNYLLTRLVLPAMFTGTHLADIPHLERPLRPAEQEARRLREVTDSGLVLRVLGEHGYDRTAVSSGWSELGLRQMDQLIDPPQLTEFEISLLRVSGLGNVAGQVRGDLISDQLRARIIDTFEAGVALAGEDHARPRFLFLHVPSPHSPVVFDAHGRGVNGSPNSSVNSFTLPGLTRPVKLHLTYEGAADVATRTLQFVDTMLARPDPPVIVIFSDHGSDSAFIGNDPLASDLHERTSNFMAFFTPGHPDLIPAGTTLVNIFPRILNAYLGTDLPIRADTVWAWRKDSSVLDLVEIDLTTIHALLR